MNKGFYSIMISLLAIIVLIGIGLQANSYKNIEKNSIEKVLTLHTRNALEDMHYAFDKSVSKAIHDSLDPNSCTVSTDNLNTNIQTNFDSIKNEINSEFNVDCSYTPNPPNPSVTLSTVTVNVDLNCANNFIEKNNEVFYIELRKSITIKKDYTITGSSPNCSITVTDVAGGYTE